MKFTLPFLGVLGAVLLVTPAQAANIYVSNGQNLGTAVNNAKGGDTVFVAPGTYADFSMSNKNFSSSAPLRVVKNGSGTVTVRRSTHTSGNCLGLTSCSYILFDGLRFEQGQTGVRIAGCHHLIFRNCEVTGAGQAGFYILNSSNYIDVRNSKTWNLGRQNPQWGEGFYVGANNSSDVPHRIWIENVEIWNVGRGEAINFKPMVHSSTIKDCNIHDIAPGTTYDNGTKTQYNEGAISMESDDYVPSARNNWVIGNSVYRIQNGLFNRGIVFFGTGNVINNNTVHTCASTGIHGHTWKNRGFTTRIFGNNVYSCNPNTNYNGLPVSTSDPGNLPYGRQTWADGGGGTPAAHWIYTDSLASDWANWSWSTTTNFSNTSPVRNGSNSVAVTYNAGWAGFSLRKGTAVSTSGYTAIKFWVHGGSGSNKSLQVRTQTADSGGDSSTVIVTATAGQWNEITVNLSALGNPSSIKRLNIQNNSANAQSVIYIDDLRLV